MLLACNQTLRTAQEDSRRLFKFVMSKSVVCDSNLLQVVLSVDTYLNLRLYWKRGPTEV